MFEITDPNAPVFVQLIAHGTARNLALPPHRERALVVGSTRDADFQVNGLRVAPVQFHLERDKGAVWLIPAYAIRDLRLNGEAVVGPTPLEEHNIVLFAGVHLEVTIRDESEFIASGDSLFTDPPSKREFRASYSMELPSEHDATHLAMTPVPIGTSPEDDWPTVNAQPTVDQAATAEEQTTQRIALFRAAPTPQTGSTAEFTLYGTQIIPRVVPGATPSTPSVSQPPPKPTAALDAVTAQAESRRLEPLQLIPLSNAPRPQPIPPRPTPRPTVSHHDSTASVGGTADVRTVVTPPPLGRHPMLLANDAAPPRFHTGSAKPPETATRRRSLLARLGLLTKARPLLVGCCAGFGAAVLTIALVAATRMVAPDQPQPVAGHAAFVSTLSALQTNPVSVQPPVPGSSQPTAGAPAVSVASSAAGSPANGARKNAPNSTRTQALY
jgi:hypothetical protein